MADTTVPTETTIATDTTLPTETTIAPDETSEEGAATPEAVTTEAPTNEPPAGSEVLLGKDGLAYLVGPVAATGLVF
jgi:hypothetical protein